MKNIKCLKNNLETLKLSENLIERLENININTIEDLWSCPRSFLKENKFSNSEISHIKIGLQLVGLDLNKKIY